LIIFGFLVFLSGIRVFLTALAFSWLGSGLVVWLIGGGGVTVGASGLVFGFFAFLLVRGFFNRNWWQILLSVVLFMAYGSILFGVLPTVLGYVSWQAHLGGAVGGVIAAILLRPKSKPAILWLRDSTSLLGAHWSMCCPLVGCTGAWVTTRKTPARPARGGPASCIQAGFAAG
jgi:membrane associated rhomboid family serine protease